MLGGVFEAGAAAGGEAADVGVGLAGAVGGGTSVLLCGRAAAAAPNAVGAVAVGAAAGAVVVGAAAGAVGVAAAAAFAWDTA